MGNVERSLTLVHGAGGGDMLKVEADAVFDQGPDARRWELFLG